VLGVLFSSTLFPERAPAGHVALTVYVGGTRQPDLARLAPEELRPACWPICASCSACEAIPSFPRDLLAHAIPQYNLGYERFLDAITLAETNMAGFSSWPRPRWHLPGNCIAGGRLARSQANTRQQGLGPERR